MIHFNFFYISGLRICLAQYVVTNDYISFVRFFDVSETTRSFCNLLLDSGCDVIYDVEDSVIA